MTWCNNEQPDDQNQQAEKCNNSCTASSFRYDVIVMLGIIFNQ